MHYEFSKNMMILELMMSLKNWKPMILITLRTVTLMIDTLLDDFEDGRFDDFEDLETDDFDNFDDFEDRHFDDFEDGHFDDFKDFAIFDDVAENALQK